MFEICTTNFFQTFILKISKKISAFPPKNVIYLLTFLMTFFLVIDVFHVLNALTPNAPTTTAQPPFFNRSFSKFHTFQHLFLHIYTLFHCSYSKLTTTTAQFPFYNCTNCYQLHVKICPANVNSYMYIAITSKMPMLLFPYLLATTCVLPLVE